VSAATRDEDRDARREVALAVVRILRDAGHEALWVGGCVRDLLLGSPPRDFDVASSASPEEVEALFPRSVPVGIAFGVVRVIVEGHEVEVARFRGGDVGADLRHRDFTINAIAYDPLREEIIDPLGGRADLERGLIRTPGEPEARFADDWLRILRAVRFSARLGFAIDEATRAAMRRHAGRLAEVSAERIRDELERLLRGAGAADGLAGLEELGVTALLLPELTDVGRARARLAQVGRDQAGLAAEVAWAATLYDADGDAPRETAYELGRRLKLSTKLARDVGDTVALARELQGYDALDVAARKRWTRSRAAPWARAVGALACAAGQASRAGLELALADAARWSEDELRPAPLVKGGDLRRLGFAPGPMFRGVLEAVEDAQLKGELRDRVAALAFAEALGRAASAEDP